MASPDSASSVEACWLVLLAVGSAAGSADYLRPDDALDHLVELVGIERLEVRQEIWRSLRVDTWNGQQGREEE